jgi:endonuclease YncB( thermonuclease family)
MLYHRQSAGYGLCLGLGFAAGVAAMSWHRGVALPVTATVAAPAVAPTPDTPPEARPPRGARYPAEVLRVIDGDTVEARIAIWLGQELVTKVRLRGIDAPELAGGCASERELAISARDRLTALIGARAVTLQEVGPDKYHGRVVARLVTADGLDAGTALMADGHAVMWTGRRQGQWCALAARP